MNKIVVITHGSLAQALVETSQLIIGAPTDIDFLGLFHGDSIDEFKQKVSDMIDKNLSEEGVLIFTDLYGGTPSNQVITKLYELKFPDHVKAYVGVNLPLLLEAITLGEHTSIDEISNHLDSLCSTIVFDLTAKFTNKNPL